MIGTVAYDLGSETVPARDGVTHLPSYACTSGESRLILLTAGSGRREVFTS